MSTTATVGTQVKSSDQELSLALQDYLKSQRNPDQPLACEEPKKPESNFSPAQTGLALIQTPQRPLNDTAAAKFSSDDYDQQLMGHPLLGAASTPPIDFASFLTDLQNLVNVSTFKANLTTAGADIQSWVALLQRLSAAGKTAAGTGRFKGVNPNGTLALSAERLIEAATAPETAEKAGAFQEALVQFTGEVGKFEVRVATLVADAPPPAAPSDAPKAPTGEGPAPEASASTEGTTPAPAEPPPAKPSWWSTSRLNPRNWSYPSWAPRWSNWVARWENRPSWMSFSEIRNLVKPSYAHYNKVESNLAETFARYQDALEPAADPSDTFGVARDQAHRAATEKLENLLKIVRQNKRGVAQVLNRLSADQVEALTKPVSDDPSSLLQGLEDLLKTAKIEIPALQAAETVPPTPSRPAGINEAALTFLRNRGADISSVLTDEQIAFLRNAGMHEDDIEAVLRTAAFQKGNATAIQGLINEGINGDATADEVITDLVEGINTQVAKYIAASAQAPRAPEAGSKPRIDPRIAHQLQNETANTQLTNDEIGFLRRAGMEEEDVAVVEKLTTRDAARAAKIRTLIKACRVQDPSAQITADEVIQLIIEDIHTSFNVDRLPAVPTAETPEPAPSAPKAPSPAETAAPESEVPGDTSGKMERIVGDLEARAAAESEAPAAPAPATPRPDSGERVTTDELLRVDPAEIEGAAETSTPVRAPAEPPPVPTGEAGRAPSASVSPRGPIRGRPTSMIVGPGERISPPASALAAAGTPIAAEAPPVATPSAASAAPLPELKQPPLLIQPSAASGSAPVAGAGVEPVATVELTPPPVVEPAASVAATDGTAIGAPITATPAAGTPAPASAATDGLAVGAAVNASEETAAAESAANAAENVISAASQQPGRFANILARGGQLVDGVREFFSLSTLARGLEAVGKAVAYLKPLAPWLKGGGIVIGGAVSAYSIPSESVETAKDVKDAFNSQKETTALMGISHFFSGLGSNTTGITFIATAVTGVLAGVAIAVGVLTGSALLAAAGLLFGVVAGVFGALTLTAGAITLPIRLIYEQVSETPHAKTMFNNIKEVIETGKANLSEMVETGKASNDDTYVKLVQKISEENPELLDANNPKAIAFWRSNDSHVKELKKDLFYTLLGSSEKGWTEWLHRNLSVVGADELAAALVVAQLSGDQEMLSKAASIYQHHITGKEDDRAQYDTYAARFNLPSFKKLQEEEFKIDQASVAVETKPIDPAEKALQKRREELKAAGTQLLEKAKADRKAGDEKAKTRQDPSPDYNNALIAANQAMQIYKTLEVEHGIIDNRNYATAAYRVGVLAKLLGRARPAVIKTYYDSAISRYEAALADTNNPVSAEDRTQIGKNIDVIRKAIELLPQE